MKAEGGSKISTSMNVIKKIIVLCFLTFLSNQLFGQLAVKSDFKRDEDKLQVILTNKSPYILFFLTQALSYPPHITIQSFDSEGEAIEWLRYPPSEHNGPYLFKEMFFILRQNESYPLSFTIKPDITKGIPKYFIVTYDLKAHLLDAKDIDNEKLIKGRSKYRKGSVSLRFAERFDFEPNNDENTVPLHSR